MTHINTILTNAARDLIEQHLAQNECCYTFDPETLIPSVTDTGLQYDPSGYPFIRDLLSRPAGLQHGVRTLKDVLTARLLVVAGSHSKRPRKAVEEFLPGLERQQLVALLAGDEDDVGQRTARLRRNLNKLGYRLTKSRTRNPYGSNYRVYDIIHLPTNEISVDAPRHLAGLERWVERQSQATLDVLRAA